MLLCVYASAAVDLTGMLWHAAPACRLQPAAAAACPTQTARLSAAACAASSSCRAAGIAASAIQICRHTGCHQSPTLCSKNTLLRCRL